MLNPVNNNFKKCIMYNFNYVLLIYNMDLDNKASLTTMCYDRKYPSEHPYSRNTAEKVLFKKEGLKTENAINSVVLWIPKSVFFISSEMFESFKVVFLK